VAKKLVVYHRRAGGSRSSRRCSSSSRNRSHPERAGYARNNLDKALTVGELAQAANLSPRQFSHAFRAETGQSPAKAIGICA
jgi:transcriptional regulator GlxA family with amidase domain